MKEAWGDFRVKTCTCEGAKGRDFDKNSFFSENISCVRINTTKTYLYLNYFKEKACHFTSLWGHRITVQESILEFAQHQLEGNHTGSDGRVPAWSVCCCHWPAVGSYATLLQALEYFFCLLCLQSLHFS